ncbi:MAG: lipoprotein signal peptidase [Sulfurovum sp.]|nr:MAG: lipoprotein signal peptidase [Sulfurovum sp.]
MSTKITFLLVLFATFFIDQLIKFIFVDGFYLVGSCIDLELHYNRGVAFSMLEFLGDNLKWIQMGLIFFILYFVNAEGYIKKYPVAVGLILGGAIGNLYDRFYHGAVVDYVAWHCGFNFAVFNYADMMIDFGVAIILVSMFVEDRREKKIKKES